MKNIHNSLIVLDGDLDKNLIRKILIQNSPRNSFNIIAADGAANTLHKSKIIPDYIIGDLDSISIKTLANYKKNKVKVKKIAEQEHNDFEKCLSFSIKSGSGDIFIVGFGGKRIDHTLNNFSVLKKYSNKADIKFIDNDFKIFFLKKKTKIKYKKNEVVSIIALPKATGVGTKGLIYLLNNGVLEFGKREGSLNKSNSNEINISFKDGSVLIFLKHFNKFRFSEI